MLDSLIKLATDCSDAKRQQFADEVSKRFVERVHLNRPDETSAFNSLLSGVVDKMDTSAKVTISERLADIDATDPGLAVKLATDKIEVARPMLERSKSLRERQLLELAESADQEHLLSLSKREYLSSRLTKKLVERGNLTVKQSVASNLGAEIDPKDVDRIIKDLPKEMGDKIRHLRRSTEDLIQEMFRDPDEVMTGEELVKRESRIDVRQWLTGIRQGHVTLNKAVSQLCFEKNLYDVVSILAVVVGLERKHVANMMIRYDSTCIAVLCRSIGIADGEYSSVCKARCMHLKFPTSTGNKWVTNYHLLDPKDAQRMLALFKAKMSAQDADAA
ncbi:DUF2336 domain-containing protein [Roseibium sp.]|uniref:DUF2336 domain-containing protein n=1 Tax=Roseibium sp. TaxID=1936156 RepID=UPI003A97C5BB